MTRVGVARSKRLARSGSEHFGKGDAGLAAYQRAVDAHPAYRCGHLLSGHPKDVEAYRRRHGLGGLEPVLRGVFMRGNGGIERCHSLVIVPRQGGSLKTYGLMQDLPRDQMPNSAFSAQEGSADYVLETTAAVPPVMRSSSA